MRWAGALNALLTTLLVHHASTTRLQAAMVPQQSPLRLSNWMGQLSPVLGAQPFLDLTLPGTHDSLTFDLTNNPAIVADNFGAPAWLYDLLHKLPLGKVGGFIYAQSRTQIATLPEQLDGGARFIDFRITYTQAPDNSSHYDWYGVHLLQTRSTALYHLQQVREWLLSHPTEVVVLWLSRHSSTCDVGTKQYPGTTAAQRQAFWRQVEALFDGLLFDSRHSALNETTLTTLQRSNQRVVVYASDWAEFTDSSPLALDACAHIDIWDPPTGVQNQTLTQATEIQLFVQAPQRMTRDRAADRWYQMFVSTSTPTAQVEAQVLLSVFHLNSSAVVRHCAESFHIPGLVAWCPASLLDIIALSNYYWQRTLEHSVSLGLRLPNTPYLGALDADGCVPVGTWQQQPKRYAYSATLLYSMVHRMCQTSHVAPPELESPHSEGEFNCSSALATLRAARKAHPAQFWTDEAHGRLQEWPSFAAARG